MRIARRCIRRVFALASTASLASLMLTPLHPSSLAQGKRPAAAGDAQKNADAVRPATCDEQRAVALVRQQAEEAKSFEASAGQIRVLLKAGDLLWPREEEAGALSSPSPTISRRVTTASAARKSGARAG